MPGEDHTGRAWIELSGEALRHNVEALRSLMPAGCELMPAVKANAYGHGAELMARQLHGMGLRSFCVATVGEGAQLRRCGITGDILVLGYTSPRQARLLSYYDLIQTVVDLDHARALDGCGRRLRVHIKLDTGMHRLGERSGDIDRIADIFRCPNLAVEGVYTHLSADDPLSPEDAAFTRAQAYAFCGAVARLGERGLSCGKTHLLASYGLIDYPGLGGDYARLGISLCGVLSRRGDLERCPVELRPVLTLKARVALTRELYRGESIGYGLGYAADHDRRIAVITIGYADGLPRSLSDGRGTVLINGCRAPIVGRVCMDQCMADITGLPDVRQGDVAVIIGKSGAEEITAYDLAEQAGTITNEILSRLGERLERAMR